MIPSLLKGWQNASRVWSIGIYVGDSPCRLQPASETRNPVLSMWDVNDVPSVGVADPFLVFHERRWYMFFEVVNGVTGRGEIAYATSGDGLRWAYQCVVLREAFHLSYPCVVWSGSSFYMVPESHQANAVRLYQAVEFPVKWRLVRQLLVGGRYVDPSLFFYNGTWWMYVKDTDTDRPVLRLFHAQTLPGPWSEHARSPVISGDWGRARPGGRVLNADGRIIRFAQDCSRSYGRRVRAFRVVCLCRDDYREEEIPLGAELCAQKRGWNAEAMHHVDAHHTPHGRWIAAVDGCRRIPAALVRYRKWSWRWRNRRYEKARGFQEVTS